MERQSLRYVPSAVAKEKRDKMMRRNKNESTRAGIDGPKGTVPETEDPRGVSIDGGTDSGDTRYKTKLKQPPVFSNPALETGF